MISECDYASREIHAIIIREYNSGLKLRGRTYLICKKIVIRKNAKS